MKKDDSASTKKIITIHLLVTFFCIILSLSFLAPTLSAALVRWAVPDYLVNSGLIFLVFQVVHLLVNVLPGLISSKFIKKHFVIKNASRIINFSTGFFFFFIFFLTFEQVSSTEEYLRTVLLSVINACVFYFISKIYIKDDELVASIEKNPTPMPTNNQPFGIWQIIGVIGDFFKGFWRQKIKIFFFITVALVFIAVAVGAADSELVPSTIYFLFWPSAPMSFEYFFASASYLRPQLYWLFDIFYWMLIANFLGNRWHGSGSAVPRPRWIKVVTFCLLMLAVPAAIFLLIAYSLSMIGG